jgi:hypothetical protein
MLGVKLIGMKIFRWHVGCGISLRSRILFAAGLSQLLVGAAYSQTMNGESQPSMMYSCETTPFLSVSVSTPKRDSMPQVQIVVTDPRSRQQGVNVSGKIIPNSHYADVVIAPKAPERSREHAVEICGAEKGEYTLTVQEHGDDLYRVDVSVEVSRGMSEYLHSREGRIRRFRFSLRRNKGEFDVTWLDNNGQPVLIPDDDSDW